MGEKGTERYRRAQGQGHGLTGSKKEHVRVVKNNQGQACFPAMSTSPMAVKHATLSSPEPAPYFDGSSKKNRRMSENSVLSQSPNSRRAGSPVGWNSRRAGSPVGWNSRRAGSPVGWFSPRNISPRTSPSLGCHYAGAKFSEPPSPDSLPKPPMRWTGFCMTPCSKDGMGKYREFSQQFTLKVEA